MDTYTFISFLATLGVPLFGIFIARLWRRTKSADSIHAQDQDLDSVAMSFVSNLGATDPMYTKDGKVILHPTIGIRFLAPLIALACLLTLDWQSLLPVHWQDTWKSTAAIGALWALFLYTTVNLIFFQKVTFDEHTIVCTGVDFAPQTRNLYDLVDIRTHERRPAFVLSFSRQDPLYVPKFISKRGAFVQIMREISTDNRARGARPQKPQARDRIGF